MVERPFEVTRLQFRQIHTTGDTWHRAAAREEFKTSESRRNRDHDAIKKQCSIPRTRFSQNRKCPLRKRKESMDRKGR